MFSIRGTLWHSSLDIVGYVSCNNCGDQYIDSTTVLGQDLESTNYIYVLVYVLVYMKNRLLLSYCWYFNSLFYIS